MPTLFVVLNVDYLHGRTRDARNFYNTLWRVTRKYTNREKITEYGNYFIFCSVKSNYEKKKKFRVP